MARVRLADYSRVWILRDRGLSIREICMKTGYSQSQVCSGVYARSEKVRLEKKKFYSEQRG